MDQEYRCQMPKEPSTLYTKRLATPLLHTIDCDLNGTSTDASLQHMCVILKCQLWSWHGVRHTSLPNNCWLNVHLPHLNVYFIFVHCALSYCQTTFCITENTLKEFYIWFCNCKWEMNSWVDVGNPTCTQMAFLYLWAISVAATINNFNAICQIMDLSPSVESSISKACSSLHKEWEMIMSNHKFLHM